jgi:16S rRNA (guanine1516-N2)-methyltransferase
MFNKVKMFNNNNILYLFGAKTDNHFVRHMVEKGLTLTDDPKLYPRFHVKLDEGEVFFEQSADESVGKFGWRKLWRKFLKQNNAVTKEPLAKAIGLKNISEKKLIVDMSCGTGKDSLLLTSFGATVHAFERNEVIYYLLLFHLLHFKESDCFPHYSFKLSLGSITDNTNTLSPEVIFFDPMYGEKANKKAAPRAQMVMFRNFVGEDSDFVEQLRKALKIAQNRVVIKRSMKSDILLKEDFSHSIVGKSTRYDVYMIHHSN